MTSTPSERRAHRRYAIECPVIVRDGAGRELTRGRSVNVSDGGLFVSPAGGVASCDDEHLHVDLRVPRVTPDACLYEEFFIPARALRHQRREDGDGVAVQFALPVALALHPDM